MSPAVYQLAYPSKGARFWGNVGAASLLSYGSYRRASTRKVAGPSEGGGGGRTRQPCRKEPMPGPSLYTLRAGRPPGAAISLGAPHSPVLTAKRVSGRVLGCPPPYYAQTVSTFEEDAGLSVRRSCFDGPTRRGPVFHPRPRARLGDLLR